LPRGWIDLGRQLAIWVGFALAYQLARAAGDRSPSRAIENGLRVVNFELRITHHLYELAFQQFVDQRQWLARLVYWSYWNSEFTVVGLALLWVYIRHHHAFTRFRNSILVANLLGLIGYVYMPMAPPRLLGIGFINDHTDGLIQLAANPYAAMPSLHAADAAIAGVALALAVGPPLLKALCLLWPLWVSFALIASANHFWLDIAAGLALAALGAWFATRPRSARHFS